MHHQQASPMNGSEVDVTEWPRELHNHRTSPPLIPGYLDVFEQVSPIRGCIRRTSDAVGFRRLGDRTIINGLSWVCNKGPISILGEPEPSHVSRVFLWSEHIEHQQLRTDRGVVAARHHDPKFAEEGDLIAISERTTSILTRIVKHLGE